MTNFGITSPEGQERIVGVAVSPGAAASTVLTADGAGGTSWASGGGSVPGLFIGPTSTRLITVGNAPQQLQATPDGAEIWVPNNQADTVSVIDDATQLVVATIADVTPGPHAILFTADSTKAYVMSGSEATIIPIDVATRVVGTPFTLAADSTCGSGALSADGTTAWFALSPALGGDCFLVPVDVATDAPGSPVGPITGITFIQGVAIAGLKAYVLSNSESIVVPVTLPGGAIGTAINVNANPYFILITPDGSKAYTTSQNDGNVLPIDLLTDTPGTPIPIGLYAEDLAISRDGTTLAVTRVFSSPDPDGVVPVTVATGTPGDLVATGADPSGAAFGASGYAYTANQSDDNVSVIFRPVYGVPFSD